MSADPRYRPAEPALRRAAAPAAGDHAAPGLRHHDARYSGYHPPEQPFFDASRYGQRATAAAPQDWAHPGYWDDPFDDASAAIPSAVHLHDAEEESRVHPGSASWHHPSVPIPAIAAGTCVAAAYHGSAKPTPAGPSGDGSRRARRDPSPSRLAYRLNRLWLTPLVRRGVTRGLPALMLIACVALYFGDQGRRENVANALASLRTAFENRPEFRVIALNVSSESPVVAQAIIQRLNLSFPVSSFHLDLEALRQQVEALDAVENAAVRLRSGGILEVVALEREPALVWRHRDGLSLVDAEGNSIAQLASREARADLPLIAGEGAPAVIGEARQLLAAAQPLRERLRGLVRVGERRWDVVLDRDQRILLPASGAVQALERVIALDAAQDLLARDVQQVDLRDPTRLTIRLSQSAMTEMNRMRLLATGVQNR